MICLLDHLGVFSAFLIGGIFGAIACPALLYIMYTAQKG